MQDGVLPSLWGARGASAGPQKVLGRLGWGPGPGLGWGRLQLARTGALLLCPGLACPQWGHPVSERHQLPMEWSVTLPRDSGSAAEPLPEPCPARGCSAFPLPHPSWPLAAFTPQALDEHPPYAGLGPGCKRGRSGPP